MPKARQESRSPRKTAENIGLTVNELKKQRLATEQRTPDGRDHPPVLDGCGGIVPCGIPHEDHNDVHLRPQVIPFWNGFVHRVQR